MNNRSLGYSKFVLCLSNCSAMVTSSHLHTNSLQLLVLTTLIPPQYFLCFPSGLPHFSSPAPSPQTWCSPRPTLSIRALWWLQLLLACFSGKSCTGHTSASTTCTHAAWAAAPGHLSKKFIVSFLSSAYILLSMWTRVVLLGSTKRWKMFFERHFPQNRMQNENLTCQNFTSSFLKGEERKSEWPKGWRWCQLLLAAGGAVELARGCWTDVWQK